MPSKSVKIGSPVIVLKMLLTPCNAKLDYWNRRTVRKFVSIMNVTGLAHGASVVEFSPIILSLK